MAGFNRPFLRLLLIVSLQSSFVLAVKNRPPAEAKAAYAIYDDINEEFVIVQQEPPRDKYVAGAKLTNSINQTGFVTLLNNLIFILLQRNIISYDCTDGPTLRFGQMEIFLIPFRLKLQVFWKDTLLTS